MTDFDMIWRHQSPSHRLFLVSFFTYLIHTLILFINNAKFCYKMRQ